MGWVLERLGADVERALTDVNVLAYALDRDGAIMWQNRASLVIGDVRGSHFSEFIVVDDRRRAHEAFTKKVLGHAPFTDYVVRVRRPSGDEVLVEVSSVPLLRDGEIVGVFAISARPPLPAEHEAAHQLTPRQLEVIRLIAEGATTDQIAERLHIARETVRNHVRGAFAELRVHSRVEAIAAARASGLLDD